MSAHGGPADWWTDETDAGRTHIATRGIVQDGLVLNLDAGVSSSYPGSGTTWNDLSGNGNDANLVNGVGYSSDNTGSMVFDGSNDYSRINSFGADSNLAISGFCWVYATNLTTDQFDGNYLNWIMNKRNLVPENSNSWQLTTANSYPRANYFDSDGNLIGAASTQDVLDNSLVQMQINQWYQVGFVTNGIAGGYSNVYLNGVLNHSDSLTGDRGTATKPLDIAKPGWTTNYLWHGNISIIQIYNRALSESEIRQNFNATRGRYGI